MKNTTRSALHPTWNHKPNVKQRLLGLSLAWAPQSQPTRNTPDMKRRHLWGDFSAATTAETASQGCSHPKGPSRTKNTTESEFRYGAKQNATERAQKCLFFLSKRGRITVQKVKTTVATKYYGIERRAMFDTEESFGTGFNNLVSCGVWYHRGFVRKRAEYCFKSTVSEERTHWASLSFGANSVSSAKNSVSSLWHTTNRLRGAHWVPSPELGEGKKTHWAQCLKPCSQKPCSASFRHLSCSAQVCQIKFPGV